MPPFYTATTLPTHGEDGNVLIWVTSIATEEVVEANEDELILADLDAQ